MTENRSVRAVHEIQQIVQEYASYSQSKNGLGTALGGLVGIVVYLINVFLGHSGGLTILLTIGLTLGWLVGKEVIRQRLYRPFGSAQEAWPVKRRYTHLAFVVVITLLMLGAWIFFLQKLYFPSPDWYTILLTLFFLLISPWIMWRYLRTTDEFVIGVFLLVACMVAGTGAAFGPATLEMFLGTLLFPLIGLGMIVKGFKEHIEFRGLAARLSIQGDKA